MTVTFLDTDSAIISAETRVAASPEEIYALISHPARHHELDGGGTVVSLRGGDTHRVHVGDQFTQNMKLGIPYTMTSTVILAEENRALAWQMPAGHIWKWEIFPQDDGTCLVRETLDSTGVKLPAGLGQKIYKTLGMYSRNRKNIALSLAKLRRTFE